MRRKDDGKRYRVMVQDPNQNRPPAKINGDLKLAKALDYQKDRIWSYLHANVTLTIEGLGDFQETGRMNHLKVTQTDGRSYASVSTYWVEEDTP